MIIGITGKSGVGKTTYAHNLNKDNEFYVISIDDVSHKVFEKSSIQKQLLNIFGNAIVNNGVIDRKKLGDIIFENRHLYKEMSDIVWDEIKKEIENILKEHKNIIFDWILLPHSHYWKMCDKKILIIANEELRKEKVLKRDNITQEYLEKRDAASITYDDIDFDEIIENSYN